MPVAIITGASKGMGRALGEALAERGWDLVLDARTEEVLRGTAKELAAHRTRVEALPGDVTDAAHRAALVAAARALGGPDLLVNNGRRWSGRTRRRWRGTTCGTSSATCISSSPRRHLTLCIAPATEREDAAGPM
ncbi:hypothetical protein GCM10027075_67100 [Streptomyces heilongjiangensis]